MRLSRSRVLRGALIACLAALAGCSLFASQDHRYDPAPLTQYAPGLAVRTVWQVSVGSGSGLGFTPAVVGDSVYAATPDGSVAKVDIATGRMVWRGSADAKLTAGVGSDGTVSVVATESGQVIAFDDTGKVKWKAQATSDVRIPPAVGAGIVAVRSGDYRIQAFDENTGERLWSVQRPGPALALRTTSQMIVSDRWVIAGMPGGRMMIIGAKDGLVKWEGSVATPKGTTDLERLTDVVGRPAVSGPLLCAVAYQGRIACFNVTEGMRVVWAKDFDGSTGLTLDANAIYAPSIHSLVKAFSLQNGTLLWTQSALKNRGLTAPAVVGHAIAMGDYEGYVHFLSTTDGHLLARLSVGGDAMLSTPQAVPQGVLVQTGSGNLVLISAH
jgi:outer membrane protein assembly factor BamB